MAELWWSPSIRVVVPADGGFHAWRPGWVRAALDTPETVLVSRRSPIATVLWVEDGSLRLRASLRRLVGADGIRRVRCLGVVDVSVPWYAGIAFGTTELADAVESAAAEASRRVDRATRAMATWLGLRGVPAVAESRSGPLAETVLTRARETSPDLIVIRDDGRHPSALRSILERAEASVLVIRDGPANPRSS
jgi:nucleotide-binding universal stress UspA family protein